MGRVLASHIDAALSCLAVGPALANAKGLSAHSRREKGTESSSFLSWIPATVTNISLGLPERKCHIKAEPNAPHTSQLA